MKKIADISKYQGNVDWSKTKDDVEFVILRASCGTSKDTRYAQNADGCAKNGIPYHAYHYLKATDFDEAVSEAEVFHKATLGTAPLFYVVDCEDSAITKVENKRNGAARAIVEAFVFELKRLVGDARVGCYIGHHLYRTWNLDYDSFAYVWIPRYGKNTGQPETKPDYPCHLWQYTSKGTLAGVKGRVDLNAINGSKPLAFFTRSEQEGDNMTYDPKKVIDIALAEVGYLEKASNANLDDKTANAGSKNYTKYARDLDALGFYNGRKQAVAWCDVFVDWCFVQAYGKDTALAITFQPTNAAQNCGAGCKYSRNYYKNNGRLYDTPEPGDQIFFYSSDKSRISHTGLVYAVDTNYVYTVEGNTSSTSGVVANGGSVEMKKYKLNYNRLAGFGRPAYSQGVEPAPALKLGDRLPLAKGDEGDDVKELQQNLIALGYDLGSYGADGEFGSKTDAAVRAFQQAEGLDVDGKFGAKSLAAMEAALAALDEKQPAQEEKPAQETTTDSTGGKMILITGKSVNARVGDSTDYDSVGHLSLGDKIEYVATAPNGWHAGRWNKRIVWVSPLYSSIL